MNSYSVYRNAFVLLCIALSIGAVVLGLRTALEAGPIWDDATEISMMTGQIQISSQPKMTYESGKALIEKSGAAGAGFYGVVPGFLAHGIETIVNGEPWAKTAYTVRNVMWRHLVCFLLTIIAAIVLFISVAMISGSWVFGIATLAVLLSTPVFLGLAMIDDKDSPIAVGLTLLSCGSALLLRRVFREQRPVGPATNAAVAALVFLGTVVAFGTRAGAAALIAVECAVVGTLLLLAIPRGAGRIASAVGILALGVFTGAFVAIYVNPLAVKDPFHWVIEGVIYAQHPATQPLKLWGQTLRSEGLPWWYVPGWIIVEYPAAFFALFFIGGIGAIRRLWRMPKIEEGYAWIPFVVQGLLLPVLIVASGAVLHDRLRHLLFIVPPLCLLAAFGLYLCVDAARLNQRWTAKGFAVGGAVLLVLTFSSSLTWFPYQYAYLNALGRAFPQYSFDTEVLGLSITEAVERMRKLRINSLRAGPAPIFTSYATDPGITVDYVSVGYRPHTKPVPGGGAYYLHSRPSWKAAGLPGFCQTLFQIERQGVVLGVGGMC